MIKFVKRWFETPKEEIVAYSDPKSIFRKPNWEIQTIEDLKRHEGFRPYAYPDPLSPLGQKYRSPKWKWGFLPGDILLAKYGESADDGRPWTVGYGFTHGVGPSTTVSPERAAQILAVELAEHVEILDNLIPQWRNMPTYVQTVLANMAYNLGGRLAQFHQTLDVIKDGHYWQAGERLKKSLWYKQVGTRAVELVERLQTGHVQDKYRVI